MTNNYLKLHINNGNTGANSLIENWNPSLATKEIKQEEFVPTKTLDQIILEERIDVNSVLATKIDVEGMEESVLKGAESFLKKNTAPIILEYRLNQVEQYLSTDMQGLVKLLKNFGYVIYSLNNDAELTDFDHLKSYENIIAFKKECDLGKQLLSEKK